MAKRKLTREGYLLSRRPLVEGLYREVMCFWGQLGFDGPNYVPDIIRDYARAITELDVRAYDAGVADSAPHNIEPGPKPKRRRKRASTSRADEVDK